MVKTENLDGIMYSTPATEFEKEAALNIYKLYKSVKGSWPKYIDDSLIELGLVDAI